MNTVEFLITAPLALTITVMLLRPFVVRQPVARPTARRRRTARVFVENRTLRPAREAAAVRIEDRVGRLRPTIRKVPVRAGR